jgi:hypothetical protein
MITTANRIIADWQAQGYDLTLRQLYYQFVAQFNLPNTEKSYNNLGNLISAGRDAGLIDWNAIVDRTRACRENSHWSSPQSIIRSCAYSYAVDTREDQPTYIEVWVEKEALAGIVGGVASENDVPYFSCRGYASATSMYDAGKRFAAEVDSRQRLVILHLGDHDPSGIDMTRDIRDRVNLYSDQAGVEVRRIALTMAQVTAQSLPPNPAKLSDSRARDYVLQYGRESWELDALPPSFITNLIQQEIDSLTDDTLLQARQSRQRTEKRSLRTISDNYDVALEAAEDAGA